MRVFSIFKRAILEFIDDDCATMAAALAYYTIFSLPPLLLVIIKLAGLLLDPEDFRGELEHQLSALIGSSGMQQIHTMLEHTNQSEQVGTLATVLGVAALLFGATGAFVQLQNALNNAWQVAPNPNRGGIWNFLGKRLLSFGMILALAFILMVSLVVSTIITALGDTLASYLPDEFSRTFLHLADVGVTLLVLTMLFGAIFKFLPDAVINWRDVWVGSLTTAVLFVLGKFLIGLYLGNSDPASAYGAAASLAILFIWVYYSSMILLFGAEFTEAWATTYGTEIRPEADAVRVIRQWQSVGGPEPKLTSTTTVVEPADSNDKRDGTP
jgi:membrane protein